MIFYLMSSVEDTRTINEISLIDIKKSKTIFFNRQSILRYNCESGMSQMEPKRAFLYINCEAGLNCVYMT